MRHAHKRNGGERPPKDDMNIDTIRPTRPKLFLPFGVERHVATQPNRSPAAAIRPGILPDHEVRRIVAAAIG